MEAMLAMPITVTQILLGTYPLFFVGHLLNDSVLAATTVWYNIPFRGSFLLLLSRHPFFLLCIGRGFLISWISKNQFLSYQIALMSAFLPAYMLSGFIFEIASMPKPIQLLT